MEQGNPVTCAYWNFLCKRESLKSSKDGYCIFHAEAEDKNEREFKKALKKYIEEGNYNFRNFVFVGDINFKKDFGVAVFKNADFTRASFQEEVYEGAYLTIASFQGKADFTGASFQGEEAYFRGASFQGGAYFTRASFQGKAYFTGASFQEEVYREAYFREVSFQGKADFTGASFQGKADFGEAEFRTRASISPKCMKGNALFGDAILENISLTPLNLEESTWIDFAGARLRNTEIRREDIEGHIKQERGKDFSKAKEIYLLLKNNFHSLGRYDDESWAFRKEKEMERKSFWHFRKGYKDKELREKWTNRGMKDCFYPVLLDLKQIVKFTQDNWFPNSWDKVIKLFSYIPNFLKQPGATIKSEFNKLRSFVLENTKERTEDVSPKEFIRALWIYIKYPLNYFWSTFLKYLYGWGEWPWLIFLWCGITIFAFSFLYCIFGNVVVTKDQAPLESYLNKLYFSGVTFTALGYGDYSPTGMAKPLAFLESFLGIFFIALFVFSFARRTAGR